MAAIKRRVRSPHVLSVCVAQVPSDGLLGASLPVTMFYVKNSTDFLGRCFTLLPLCIKSQKVYKKLQPGTAPHHATIVTFGLLACHSQSLGVAVLARFLLVPLFFWYALAPPFGSDLFILGVVAISGVTSGYLVRFTKTLVDATNMGAAAHNTVHSRVCV